jgi:hypothetical protein
MERRRRAFLLVSLSSKAIRFESFERRCRGLFERNIELLHRGQRLAQLTAQLGCRFAQRIQHLFLGSRRHLLLGQRVSTLAVHRFQLQHVLAAQTGNRPGKVSLTARPLAKFSRNVGRELVSRGRVMSFKVAATLLSGSTFRNGD